MISKLKIWHSDKRADLVLGKNVIDVKALRYFLLSTMFSEINSIYFQNNSILVMFIIFEFAFPFLIIKFFQ